MSKELVTQQNQDFQIQLDELEKIQETCRKLLQTKHYQNLGEAGVYAIMARAKALGLHPFEALNGGFHCINGKVGMSTEMMSALVRKRGHSIQKDPKSNNECCILHGTRADNGDKMTVKFDKEDAMAAGLWNGPTWKKYPGVMLYNRAMSMLFRQLFSDLSLGAGYVEDELKEITRTGEYKTTIELNPETVIENVKPFYIEKVKTEAKETVAPLSKDQAHELGDILCECDPQYEKDLLAHYKVDKVDDLPSSNFERIKHKALAQRELYQVKKKMQEFKQEVA